MEVGSIGGRDPWLYHLSEMVTNVTGWLVFPLFIYEILTSKCDNFLIQPQRGTHIKARPLESALVQLQEKEVRTDTSRRTSIIKTKGEDTICTPQRDLMPHLDYRLLTYGAHWGDKRPCFTSQPMVLGNNLTNCQDVKTGKVITFETHH